MKYGLYNNLLCRWATLTKKWGMPLYMECETVEWGVMARSPQFLQWVGIDYIRRYFVLLLNTLLRNGR